MNNELIEAAQALVDRWDCPAWKETEHTGAYIARLRRAVEQAAIPDPCEWLQDEWDNSYDTSCGNKYEIIDGTPEDNGMNYCTYCGGKLEAITSDATRAETRRKHE